MRLVYTVLIATDTFEPEITARHCPRCALAEYRARRFGQVDRWAVQAARCRLVWFFGEEDLRIHWLQQGDRRWAALCCRLSPRGRRYNRDDPHDPTRPVAKKCHEVPRGAINRLPGADSGRAEPPSGPETPVPPTSGRQGFERPEGRAACSRSRFDAAAGWARGSLSSTPPALAPAPAVPRECSISLSRRSRCSIRSMNA
jgi:hypothetical protein